MINRHLHLQHYRHSGSALHHRHTSYRAIVAILVLAGVFMVWLAHYSNNTSSIIGPSVEGFITAFALGLYALTLVIVVPFARSSKYAPEIISSENNQLFED